MIHDSPMTPSSTRLFLGLFASFMAAPAVAQIPTWSDDIACIVYTHCTPCHHDGGMGHFSLVEYPQVHVLRNEILQAVQVRYMPPWPPDHDHTSFIGERVLSQEEIDLIAAWVLADAPLGDPSQAPPPPDHGSQWELDTPDISVIMPDYAIPPSSTDNYRCFVIPTGLEQTVYITAMEVIPGDPEMVHHVGIFSDDTGMAAQLDANDPAPGYAGFGGVGVPSARFLGVWVPGDRVFRTPDEMGIELPANSDIILQVHYPATSLPAVDSTRLNLMYTTEQGVRQLRVDPLLTHLQGTLQNGPLVIWPGEVATFHSMTTLNQPTTITGISPHAHLICTRMWAYAVLPGSDTIPLIDIPYWDFRWQGYYPYRHLIHLPAGTQVHGFATYDNTSANPSNPNSPPQVVTAGENTTDEMLIFFFGRTPGTPADAGVVVDTTSTPIYQGCDAITMDLIEHAGTYMKVFPVPAQGMIQVSGLQAGGEILLLDMSGRIVLRDRSRREMHLGLEGVAAGPYILQYRPPDGGPVLTHKVIIE